MRLANVRGRSSLVVGDWRCVDVEEASSGSFPAGVMQLIARWDEFRAWYAERPPGWSVGVATSFDPADLYTPVTHPLQIFAVGLNYGDHGSETGYGNDTEPVVFAKFPSSLCGPYADVSLPSEHVDWEAELVAVIGRRARRIAAGSEWDYVAGLTVGQDLSERRVQFAAPPAQFSLAKSFENFSPVGPWLVTADEFDDPTDIEVRCLLNGDLVQRDRVSSMIHSIPELVRKLSNVVELTPGDLIFTGTPAGVGMAMEPPRYLRPGDHLTTWVSEIGELHQKFHSSTWR